MGQRLSSASSTDKSKNKTATSSSLLQAAMQGDFATVQSLIQKHIMGAKQQDDEDDNVQKLLKQFVNTQDMQGNTALHGAIFAGHLDITKYLIDECYADDTLCNSMGCSPLWLAAGYGHVTILEYLLQRHHDDEDNWIQAQIFKANASGDTPLLAATSKGHSKICEILLQQTTSSYDMLCRTNRAGDTPLSVCVGAGHEGPLLTLLLEEENKHAADDRPLNRQNSKQLTPLLVACERNFATIVETLLQQDAIVVDTCDSTGKSPLSVAVFCGCHDVVEMLLPHNKTKQMLNQVDFVGCTPLWLAARTANVKMVNLLRQAGADDTIPNKDGLTPLQAAEKYKKDAVVDVLKNYNNQKQ